MPLLVSDQCVKAICFDRLREMFDSEVPFPVARANWMAFLLRVIHARLTGTVSVTRGGKKQKMDLYIYMHTGVYYAILSSMFPIMRLAAGLKCVTVLE